MVISPNRQSIAATEVACISCNNRFVVVVKVMVVNLTGPLDWARWSDLTGLFEFDWVRL